MITRFHYLEAPPRLRAFVRAHETSLVVLAALVGTLGGLAVAAMSAAVEALHVVLFNLQAGDRLSSQLRIEPLRALLVPSLGGLLLGIAFMLLARFRPAREIDPIEANALHGGRMSFRGSVSVALQTIWSSGVGASVGLEAGYTQLSSGLAASLGRGFHLRRADQRLMVGCGAAAAIAGAFLPLPHCSGFSRRCSVSELCAASRSWRRCCRRRVSGHRCARRLVASWWVCSR